MGVEFNTIVAQLVTFTLPVLAAAIALWLAIQKGFDRVNARIERLADDHNRLAGGLADIRVEVAVVQRDVSHVQQKVTEVDQKVDKVQQKVAEVDQKVDKVQKEVTEVKSEVGELRDEVRARPGDGAAPAPGTSGEGRTR